MVDLSVSASQMVVLICGTQSSEAFSWMSEAHRAAPNTSRYERRQTAHQNRLMMMMKTKTGLVGLFLLLFLSRTVSGLGSVVSRHYSYHNSHTTWHAAQSYCRSHYYYNDLATIFTQSDTNTMHMDRYNAWIGLHREDASSSWIWSDGQENNLQAWAQNEPHPGETCAFVSYSSRQVYGTGCGGYVFVICQKPKASNNFDFEFVPQSKTQSEALQYCRSVYDDLATFKDSSKLNSNVKPEDFPVWIGLHRDGGSWKWSAGLSEYRNWGSNQPGNNGNCVSISSLSKEMETQDCSARFPFVCFRDNLVLVKENMTWEEALEHCRTLRSPTHHHIRYELLSVQPGVDYSYVMTKVREADTEKVWAGLRFLAGHWLWVNKANMMYSDLPPCPVERQHCGSLSKNDTGSMETTDCSEKWNFLCYSK